MYNTLVDPRRQTVFPDVDDGRRWCFQTVVLSDGGAFRRWYAKRQYIPSTEYEMGADSSKEPGVAWAKFAPDLDPESPVRWEEASAFPGYSSTVVQESSLVGGWQAALIAAEHEPATGALDFSRLNANTPNMSNIVAPTRIARRAKVGEYPSTCSYTVPRDCIVFLRCM
ncbi:hypothetical protein N7520_011993 [Penicillium odoratum]|uniref:uncharacterized protein n=1 Tax=Penicillium odoratum TaxID=1167516 RepID=UPI002547CD98|nr:uncharacterized protein N7520_011993 [Penicillium odoratum]KAJ5746811.1 hypothetical protein N7520_011993 [Penicillium odoratum]